MDAELALDESTQNQSLLDQIVNAKPSRCVGFQGLGAAKERLATPGDNIELSASLKSSSHLPYLAPHLN